MKRLEDVNRLGLGEAIPISALQGEGMADIAILIERMKQQKLANSTDGEGDDLAWTASVEEETKPLQLAVLGRQNVGKSTLVNTLVQDERVLAGPIPGLTRDAISIDYTWEGQPIQLVCRPLII
jgi:GTP-binding protein